MDPFHGGYQIYRDTLVYQKVKKCKIAGFMDQRSTFSLSGKAMLQHHDTLQNNALLCCFLVDKNNKSQVNSSKTILQTILIHRFPAANYIQTPHQFFLFFFKIPLLLFFHAIFSLHALPKLVSTISASGVISHKTVKVRRSTFLTDRRTPRSSRTVDFFRFKPFLRCGGNKRYTATAVLLFLFV